MSSLPSGGPLRLRAVSELTARPYAWLWSQRLALGEASLFEGDPGLGKSLVALDLCARLSTGRPYPDGQPALGGLRMPWPRKKGRCLTPALPRGSNGRASGARRA